MEAGLKVEEAVDIDDARGGLNTNTHSYLLDQSEFC